MRHPLQIDKVLVEDMTCAYMEFVEGLFDYLNNETNNKVRIRELNMAYIEFGMIKALEETSPSENSKLKTMFLDKLLSLINIETELIYRQMEYPKFFINIESECKSPFYINYDIITSIDVMEVVSGFYNIKNAIYHIDRKELFFSDFAQIFEKMFNVVWEMFIKRRFP